VAKYLSASKFPQYTSLTKARFFTDEKQTAHLVPAACAVRPLTFDRRRAICRRDVPRKFSAMQKYPTITGDVGADTGQNENNTVGRERSELQLYSERMAGFWWRLQVVEDVAEAVEGDCG